MEWKNTSDRLLRAIRQTADHLEQHPKAFEWHVGLLQAGRMPERGCTLAWMAYFYDPNRTTNITHITFCKEAFGEAPCNLRDEPFWHPVRAVMCYNFKPPIKELRQLANRIQKDREHATNLA